MDGICGYLINLLPNRITEVKLSNLKSRDLKHSQNSLLASLPGATYRRIEERSERVELDYGLLVYKAGSVIRQIYFPKAVSFHCSQQLTSVKHWKSASSEAKE